MSRRSISRVRGRPAANRLGLSPNVDQRPEVSANYVSDLSGDYSVVVGNSIDINSQMEQWCCEHVAGQWSRQGLGRVSPSAHQMRFVFSHQSDFEEFVKSFNVRQ